MRRKVKRTEKQSEKTGIRTFVAKFISLPIAESAFVPKRNKIGKMTEKI